jgi:hypothetical protein
MPPTKRTSAEAGLREIEKLRAEMAEIEKLKAEMAELREENARLQAQAQEPIIRQACVICKEDMPRGMLPMGLYVCVSGIHFACTCCMLNWCAASRTTHQNCPARCGEMKWVTTLPPYMLDPDTEVDKFGMVTGVVATACKAFNYDIIGNTIRSLLSGSPVGGDLRNHFLQCMKEHRQNFPMRKLRKWIIPFFPMLVFHRNKNPHIAIKEMLLDMDPDCFTDREYAVFKLISGRVGAFDGLDGYEQYYAISQERMRLWRIAMVDGEVVPENLHDLIDQDDRDRANFKAHNAALTH